MLEGLGLRGFGLLSVYGMYWGVQDFYFRVTVLEVSVA